MNFFRPGADQILSPPLLHLRARSLPRQQDFFARPAGSQDYRQGAAIEAVKPEIRDRPWRAKTAFELVLRGGRVGRTAPTDASAGMWGHLGPRRGEQAWQGQRPGSIRKHRWPAERCTASRTSRSPDHGQAREPAATPVRLTQQCEVPPARTPGTRGRARSVRGNSDVKIIR
ncbi:hypothetical protein VTN02DRAFT_6806 [Thermoascus thermophilus]